MEEIKLDNNQPHYMVDDVNPMVDTFGEEVTQNTNKILKVEDELL